MLLVSLFGIEHINCELKKKYGEIVNAFFFSYTVKKAYHKLSLEVHPDRVNEDDKLEATEKFKVLGAVHSILSDPDKRAIYDETGTVDNDEDEIVQKDWTKYWRIIFRKVTMEDIVNYEKQYIGNIVNK